MTTMDILKEDEGFRGTVYQCTEGFDTIGYGTKLPLNEKEAELLLINRLREVEVEVQARLSHLRIEDEAWDILYLMAYQMGVPRLMKFKKMIKALENEHYGQAGVEMLDSRWAKQTPYRASRMAHMMGIIQ